MFTAYWAWLIKVNVMETNYSIQNKMATSLNLGFDPVVLSDVVERKGTLFLRSDHMKYGRTTLNTDWSVIIIVII